MSMSACKRVKKYPREAGDIGDIGDIFCKSLKLLDFLNGGGGDISGDIFGDGDLSPSAPSHDATEVFPKRKQFGNPEPSSMALGSCRRPPEKIIYTQGYLC